MAAGAQVQGGGTSGGRGTGLYALLGFLALAVLAGVGLWIAGQTGRAVRIALDPDSGLTLDVAAADSFADVVGSALEADRTTVEAILKSQGFYQVSDPDLVAKLETLTREEPPHDRVVSGLRRLLRDQRGPFLEPASLREIDGRLISAFAALDEQLRSAQETNGFIMELWRDSLEYQGLFRTRVFNADVTQLFFEPRDAESVEVLACPGNEFVGMDVTVFLDGAPGQVTGRVVSDPVRLNCQNSAETLAQLFAGKSARIGLDRAAFGKLAAPADPTASLPPRLDARFLVHPIGSLVR
jgi:hypothetical protein